MSYSVITRYGAAGNIVGRIRCQTQHIDGHPMPHWVARQEVEHVAASAPASASAQARIDSGVVTVGVRPHAVVRPPFPQTFKAPETP